MATIRARLLGSPRFALDDRTLEVPSGKVQALLCYLLATRQVHSRERLAGFLWPDVPERNALASLRTALYDLRKRLGPEGDLLLFVERTRVGIPVDAALDLDIAALETLGDADLTGGTEPDMETLERAVAAWRGEFLEGVSLPDAYDFDDWVFLERERLSHLYLQALCRLGERRAAAGDYGRAADAARRVLAIDPLREEIHRTRMLYLALDGQRGAAIAQFRSCKERLERELGIEPLAATVELYERIARDEPLAAPAAGPAPVARAAGLRSARRVASAPPPTIASASGPFVGREAERALLARAWSEACEGKGGLVTLRGEAGIGKSRLLQDVVEEDFGGAAVLLGRCFESAGHGPYGPVVDALRPAVGARDLDALGLAEVWQRELGRLLPELESRVGTASAPLDGVRDRERLFEAVRCTLAALAAERPVVLVFEDVHWADDTSLSLITYLARRLDGLEVLLLVSFRDEELSRERGQALVELERAGRSLALSPLSARETAELVGLLADADPPPDRFGGRLHQRTGGNPLFLTEMLRALFEQGSLELDEDGAWTTTPGSAASSYAALPVPESVGLVVDARLDRLDDDARALVDCAAILRRDFSFELLQRVTGLTAGPALDGLDGLLGAGILRESAEGSTSPRYDFQHAIVRDRVYGRLSGARRQHLHRQVAGYLDSLPAVPPDRVAYHYMRGGVRDRACAWALRAGHAALAVHAGQDALAHFGTARELAVDAREEHAALAGAGDAFVSLGRPAEAILAYTEALSVAPEAEAEAELQRRIGRAQERQGRYDRALEAYGTARALLGERVLSLSAVRTADGMATVYIRLGRIDEAAALCRDALLLLGLSGDALDEADRARGEAWVRNTLGMAYLHGGDYPKALGSLERSLESKRALGDRLGEATLLNNLGVVHYHCGDDEEALRYYGASLAIKEEIGDAYGRAIALTNVSLMETHLRRYEEAAAHLAEAETAAGATDAAWLLPEIRRIAAQRALALGEVEEAVSQARAALAEAEELGVPAHIGVAHRVLGLVEAVAAGESGAAERADEHFETSLAVFEMLENEHELAKTHAVYGEVLLQRGAVDAAEDHLSAAFETFERSGAQGRARKLRELLTPRER